MKKLLGNRGCKERKRENKLNKVALNGECYFLMLFSTYVASDEPKNGLNLKYQKAHSHKTTTIFHLYRYTFLPVVFFCVPFHTFRRLYWFVSINADSLCSPYEVKIKTGFWHRFIDSPTEIERNGVLLVLFYLYLNGE